MIPTEAIIEWLQHPLTRFIVFSMVAFVVSGFLAIAAGIWAVVRFVHPHIKQDIVADAQKPFNTVRADYATKFERLEIRLDGVADSMDVMNSKVGEIDAKVDNVEQGMAAINGKLSVMMNGHYADRRGESRAGKD